MGVVLNPALGTLGEVSENDFSGQPMPCEGNWSVSLVPDETQD